MYSATSGRLTEMSPQSIASHSGSVPDHFSPLHFRVTVRELQYLKILFFVLKFQTEKLNVKIILNRFLLLLLNLYKNTIVLHVTYIKIPLTHVR